MEDCCGGDDRPNRRPAKKDKEEEADEPVSDKIPIRFYNPGEVRCSMKDVGGYEEAKLEVIEYVNFINHSERYRKLGAHMPKGALLFGPPGTGKTLLARATAGEANIPFIACSSASLLVGTEGSKRLAKIFEFALGKAPCVLYFDEIDCIGLKRSCREATQESRALTEELLVQLDGFQQNSDKLVLILASTNHRDELDEALTRPGRFDRVIEMPAPDLPTRLCILKVHLAPLTTNLDKEFVAKRFGILTAGLTGAQIAAMCNESAMIAARDLNDSIGMEHFESALDRVRSGIKKKKQMDEDEKLKAAYHDAAHAVVGWFLEGASPPTKLGILANTSGEIECSQVDLKELPRSTKSEAKNIMAVMMAGAAAEELVYGSYASNCKHDFEKATKIALKMVSEYGLGDKASKVFMKGAFTAYGMCNQKYRFGPQTLDTVHSDLKALLDECFAIAKDTLVQRRAQLDEIAKLLTEKNLLTLDMLVDILGPSPHVAMDKLKIEDADFLPAGMKGWNQGEKHWYDSE